MSEAGLLQKVQSMDLAVLTANLYKWLIENKKVFVLTNNCFAHV